MPRNVLLTVAEVADRLKLKPETVRVLLRRGDLVGTRVGPQGPNRKPPWRVTERSLDNYLLANQAA